jgi:2-furoyl-CoA dehydrogenase FAD binding subunit
VAQVDGPEGGTGVKPPAFDYVRVDTVDEAVELLARHGEDARVLAGGQSLMPMLNMRLVQPRVLIDITRCAGLDLIDGGGALDVGAAVTQAELERRSTLEVESPLLAHALPHISHFQVRSRGTVCGSIAHAEPSAELPLVLAALNGSVRLRSRKGCRELGADTFFTGMLTTARRADELVEVVRFPMVGQGEHQGFTEFSLRHGDFAVVALAASVTPARIRLAVGGVEDRPRVVEWPWLAGTALDDGLNELAWSLDARNDPHASARQRRQLVRRLGRELIGRLCA